MEVYMASGSFDLITVLFGLFGGLAIFIYGMNLMGEGLKKAAGERMRRILEVLTGHPVVGVLVGALVTALIQSSSATTVMVVGFVSAKLMTLPQAIGVIMGANIGTTVTAQLIAFKIGHYAYPIAALGFIFYFFFKKKIIKYIGQTVFAFGLLFIGLNIMSDVMEPLAQSDAFASLILQIKNIPVLGLLAGTAMTVIIQSSSAVIAVLQNLASTPQSPGSTMALIDLPTALPILFGSNIGTTITAILASIGASLNAKRAALAHSIFNILGSVIFMFFIPVISRLIQLISPSGPEVHVISRQIANAHTAFNLLNTIIWIPFIFILARIVTFIVRGEEESIEKRVLYLDNKVLNNPSIAMDLATRELSRMALLSKKMMASANQAFTKSNLEEAKKVYEIEETIDMLQYEIVKYLSTMLSQSILTERQSIRLAGLMHVTGDIERIGDHCENIAEFAEIKDEEGIPFSQEAIIEISDAFRKVNKIVDDSIHALHDGNIDLAKQVIQGENEIDELEASLRSRHLDRLNKGLCNPHAAITFIEMIHNLEKIADHCKNIAEAVLDDYGNRNSKEK
jgi:phosphate:Na+ symporter